MGIATCIGCGCTDTHACVGDDGPCHWMVVDYATHVGVCSYCEGHLARWSSGDRSVIMMVAKITKVGEDEPYYLEANNMGGFPAMLYPEPGDKFALEWLEMSQAAFEALPQFEYIRLAQRWAKLVNQICDAQTQGDSNTVAQLTAETEQLRNTIAAMGYDVTQLVDDDELPESFVNEK